MIIPFDINFREEIESGKYKTVAHNGQPVKIICWDARNYWNTPIIGLYYNGEVDVSINYDIHGASGNNETSLWIETGESKDEKTRTQLLDFLEHLHSQGKSMDFDVWSKADCANWILWLEKQKEQKPVEWSEEEDQLIGFIFDLLNDLFWRKDWAMSKEECLERLKSLRPQPKSVWSKDDENMIWNIISIVGQSKNIFAEEIIDWLKSLRPQNLPTWERDIPETHDPYTWFVRNGYRISIDDLWKKLPKKEGEE